MACKAIKLDGAIPFSCLVCPCCT